MNNENGGDPIDLNSILKGARVIELTMPQPTKSQVASMLHAFKKDIRPWWWWLLPYTYINKLQQSYAGATAMNMVQFLKANDGKITDIVDAMLKPEPAPKDDKPIVH